MNHTRNPTRRNRNIGTAKQGHGADNELVIPAPLADDRIHWERLRNPREFKFDLYGDERVVLIEEPAEDNFYGCTVPDLMRLLSLLPEEHLDGLDIFLFRQPTKKQRILEPVWGRFMYYATPGKHQGSGICFESQTLEPNVRSRSVNPEQERELDRLRRDGHEVIRTKRAIEVRCSRESIRNTTLYRTAIHEVGHYYDWLIHALNPQEERDELAEQEAERDFDTKIGAVREDFAHRYATETAGRLQAAGALPFDAQWDEDAMATAGIARSWFV